MNIKINFLKRTLFTLALLSFFAVSAQAQTKVKAADIRKVNLKDSQFHLRAKLTIHNIERSGARLQINRNSQFVFDNPTNGNISVKGPIFGQSKTQNLVSRNTVFEDSQTIVVDIIRENDLFQIQINQILVSFSHDSGDNISTISFNPGKSTIAIKDIAYIKK